MKDPPTSPPPPPAELAIPLPAAGGTAGPGEVGAERCEGLTAAARLRSAGGAVRRPGCASAPGHGGRCAAPVVGGGCWGGGGERRPRVVRREALRVDRALGGGGGGRRRAGGSAGPAGPGDGGRGGLPGGQAAVASVLGPCGLSFGLGPHGGGGGERRSRACAAHSGLASRHGAGHERGGAPGPSGEWRPRQAREAGAAGPVGGLPGGLCEGGGEAGVTQFRAPGSPERPPPAPRRLGTRAPAGVASASGCAPQFLLGGGRGARSCCCCCC